MQRVQDDAVNDQVAEDQELDAEEFERLWDKVETPPPHEEPGATEAQTVADEGSPMAEDEESILSDDEFEARMRAKMEAAGEI